MLPLSTSDFHQLLTVLLQYAAVMNLPADLKLKGNDFSNAGSAFFIAYLIAEIPNGMLQDRRYAIVAVSQALLTRKQA